MTKPNLDGGRIAVLRVGAGEREREAREVEGKLGRKNGHRLSHVQKQP